MITGGGIEIGVKGIGIEIMISVVTAILIDHVTTVHDAMKLLIENVRIPMIKLQGGIIEMESRDQEGALSILFNLVYF